MTNYAAVAEKYKEYICPKMTTEQLIAFVEANYDVKRVDEEDQPFGMNTPYEKYNIRGYCNTYGVKFPAQGFDFIYYEVVGYDHGPEVLFSNSPLFDQKTFLIIEKNTGYFISNSSALYAEIKVVKGIGTMDPEDILCKDYLAVFQQLFEENPFDAIPAEWAEGEKKRLYTLVQSAKARS